MRGAVNGLVGKGRTPIGNSLLAVPDDLGPAEGRRSVILVSDGGDNCAPPDPCEAAARGLPAGRRPVDLGRRPAGQRARPAPAASASPRPAAGPTSTSQDADELGDELAALLTRAFRSYEPAGTKVTGGPPQPAGRGARSAGLFQDALRARRARAGTRSRCPRGGAAGLGDRDPVRTRPRAERRCGPSCSIPTSSASRATREVLLAPRAAERDRVRAQSLRCRASRAEGAAAGRYTSGSRSRTGSQTDAGPGRARRPAARARRGGGLTRAAGRARDAAADARPRRLRRTPRRTSPRRAAAAMTGSSVLVVAGVGVGGPRGRACSPRCVLTRRRPACGSARRARRGARRRAAAPPLRRRAQEPTPVVGGGSFNAAPVLEPGRYRDTVLPDGVPLLRRAPRGRPAPARHG